MLFLWIYGDNVERRLGPFWYVVWYLLTGAAAVGFHAVFFLSSDVPLVGASGAISGILGFYFIWFPKNTVRVAVFLPPFFLQTFQIPARIVLGIYLFIDNVLPFLFAGGGGVAHGAHIGGFLAGAAAALVMNWRAMARSPKDIRAPKDIPSGGQAVRAALERGDYEEAASEYLSLSPAVARGAMSPAEAVPLAQWLRKQDQPDAALKLLQRVVRGERRGTPGLAEANAEIGFILLDDRHDVAAAYQYLVAALQQGVGPATAAEIRRRLAAIEALQGRKVGRLRSPGW
jgi:hypothetical protein